MPTVGTLSRKFRAVYKLEPNLGIRHDAIHIISGLGIGIAEELRVAVLETHIRQNYWNEHNRSLEYSFERQEDLHNTLVKWMLKEGPLNAKENGIDKERFHAIQAKTEILTRDEVTELHNLGKEIYDAIIALTGKAYMDIPREDIGTMDFSKVDFTAQVRDIKARHDTPKNAEIARQTADLFFEATRGTARHMLIPAPNSPWHGAGAAPFQSHFNFKAAANTNAVVRNTEVARAVGLKR